MNAWNKMTAVFLLISTGCLPAANADMVHISTTYGNGIGDVHNIAYSKNYAYVIHDVDDLSIFDVLDPMHPVKVSDFRYDAGIPYGPVGISVVGDNYLYMGYCSGLIQVLDIQNPSHPISITEIKIPPPPAPVTEAFCIDKIVIANGYAYLIYGDRLVILDISEPSNPTVKGQFFSTDPNERFISRAIAVTNKIAYILSRRQPARQPAVYKIDINDKSNPILMNVFPIPQEISDDPDQLPPITAPHNLAVKGGYLYIAYARASMPSMPPSVQDRAGIYIMKAGNGKIVKDYRDFPSIGLVWPGFYMSNMSISGNSLYLAGATWPPINGFVLRFDISNPLDLLEKDAYISPDTPIIDVARSACGSIYVIADTSVQDEQGNSVRGSLTILGYRE